MKKIKVIPRFIFRWIEGVAEEEQVHKKPKYDLGTRLQKGVFIYRHARAGEDLGKGTLVEPSLAARIASSGALPTGQDLNDLIYGDVRSAPKVDKQDPQTLGWPMVNVKKGRFCWLQEPPMGTIFFDQNDPDSIKKAAEEIARRIKGV